MSDIDSDQLVTTVTVDDVPMTPCFEWGVSKWGETTSYWGLRGYATARVAGDGLAYIVTVSDMSAQPLITDGLAAAVSVTDVVL
jgi:hypothetical protein